MDTQSFSFYRKNTIYLFIIAALLIAVSLLATVLVLIPLPVLFQDTPLSITIFLWILLLLGTMLGNNKKVALFTIVVSIMGFICSFALSVSLFSKGNPDAVSLFLFWISQILNAVFILSSYFSIQGFLEMQNKKTQTKLPRKTKESKTK